MDSRLSAAAEWLRGRLPHPPLVGVILGSGLGDFADGVDERVTIPYGDIPGFPAVGRGRALGNARGGHGARRSDGRSLGTRPLLRRPSHAGRRLPRARPRPPRLPDGHRDERRRRHRQVLQVRQSHAHRGSHQRVRDEPARRRERRGPRPAIPRHVGRLPQGPPLARPRRREAAANPAEARRLRRRPRPLVRDAGRDPGFPRLGRARGRHVHGARGHRAQPDGRRRPRYLVHHEHGGRRVEAEARPPGSPRDDAARERRLRPPSDFSRPGARHRAVGSDGRRVSAGPAPPRPARRGRRRK